MKCPEIAAVCSLECSTYLVNVLIVVFLLFYDDRRSRKLSHEGTCHSEQPDATFLGWGFSCLTQNSLLWSRSCVLCHLNEWTTIWNLPYLAHKLQTNLLEPSDAHGWSTMQAMNALHLCLCPPQYICKTFIRGSWSHTPKAMETEICGHHDSDWQIRKWALEL